MSEKRISTLIFFIIAFIGWFASGSLPLIMLSRSVYDDGTIADEAPLVYSYMAVMFMIAGLLSNPQLIKKAIEYGKQSIPILVIIVSGIMQAIVAIALEFYIGVAYACLLLGCILFSLAFWCLPEGKRIFLYKCLLVLNVSYVSVAFLIHGAPQDRFVGGIHPNLFGQASIILAFSGLMILNGLKKTFVFLLSIFIAFVVSSRYAIAAVLIMWFGDFLLDTTWTKTRLLTAVGSVIAIAVIEGYPETSIDLLGDVFLLNDPDRGRSSGISGRDYNWSLFLPQFEEHPLFGYGFRNILGVVGSHNGFMEYILENGLVISILFFAASFFILISNLSAVWRSLSDRAFQAREGRVVLVTLIGIFFAANLQPQLINFGDQFGALTLVTLLYVPKKFRSFERRLKWSRRLESPA